MSTMSEQPNNNASLVHCRQMSYSDFDQLAVKDSCTIYFVNQSGVFTGQSMEEEGDIYLGEKLLTGQPDLTGVMRVDGTALALDNITGSSFYEEFEFSSELTNAIILDFFLHATVQHDSNIAVNVECWIEMGHYEENKYVTDFVVVSGQASLAAARNSVPVSANISAAGTLGGPLQSKFLRICFEATGTINVKRYTDTNNKDRASQVLIRVYKAINT